MFRAGLWEGRIPNGPPRLPGVIRGDEQKYRIHIDSDTEAEEAMEHFGGAEILVPGSKASAGNSESRLLVPFIVI